MGAYFALGFKDHQICLAHILRKVQGLLKEAIHKRNESPSTKMETSPWLKKLDDQLKLSLGHLKKILTGFAMS